MRTAAVFSLTLASSLAFAAPALAAQNELVGEGAQPSQGFLERVVPRIEDTPFNRQWTGIVGAEGLINGKVKLEGAINPQLLPLFGMGVASGRSTTIGTLEFRAVTGNATFGNWMYLVNDNATGVSGHLGRIGFTRNFSPFDGVRIEPGLGLGYLGIGVGNSTITNWNGVAATLNVIGRPRQEWPWRYNVNTNYTHMLATGGNLFAEVGVDYLPSINFWGIKSDVTLGVGAQAFLVGQFAGNWSPALRVGIGL